MPAASSIPAEVAALARRFDADLFRSKPGLEEVCVADAGGMAAGLAFLLARLKPDARLVAFAAPKFWFSERGRPYGLGLRGLGLAADRILVVNPRTEAETLWALEEVLRSGAAALAVGGASLVATRRLDMIGREAGAAVALVRTTPPRNLSAARRRWRLNPAPSAPNPYDAKASGPPRWRAALERSRDGAHGEAVLEFDDVKSNGEAFRLRLVDGLADHRLDLGANRSSRAA